MPRPFSARRARCWRAPACSCVIALAALGLAWRAGKTRSRSPALGSGARMRRSRRRRPVQAAYGLGAGRRSARRRFPRRRALGAATATPLRGLSSRRHMSKFRASPWRSPFRYLPFRRVCASPLAQGIRSSDERRGAAPDVCFVKPTKANHAPDPQYAIREHPHPAVERLNSAWRRRSICMAS